MTNNASQKSTKKITISLPEGLAERFKAQVPPRQRSIFIAKILEERLALEEQINALEESAGCWKDENHPELTGSDDSIDTWLVNLRSNWQRTGS